MFDDVSKVTFWLGLGRVWTPSVIFRTLSPIRILSVLGYYLLSAVIWILVLYLFVSWLVGVDVVIYVLLGSIVNYCDLTICEQIHRITCMF